MKIPKIEYDVYHKKNGTNLVKLDLSVCHDSKVSLFIPMELSDKIDILNSSSGYYNDICYTATSERNTDIILNDRKKEFIDGNKTVCQDECTFAEYDYRIEKAKCSCQVKQSSNSFSEMVIKNNKLFEKVVDIKNIINLELMHCYKSLFNKNGIIKNLAFYIIIAFISFQIIVIIIFYKNQINKINNKIKDITFGINNWSLVREERQKARKSIQKKVFNNKNIINSQNPPKKRKIEIKLLNNIGNINNINNTINITNNNPNNVQNVNLKEKENSNMQMIYQNQEKQEIINKVKVIMSLRNEEKNNLSFKRALKVDKRTFCEYYISLIQIKHILFFSFYYDKDYNSKIIKIDLFFIGFIINYFVNGLFFTDDTMHKIYEDYGVYNFIFQLPQIIYSSLIFWY